jgi:hypothetical protein
VALPELPTVGEFVQGYEVSLWWGVGAPKNTPTEIVIKLNREINLGLADSGIRERLAQLGVEVLSGSPADFAQLIAADAERWGRVIRAANIKVLGIEAALSAKAISRGALSAVPPGRPECDRGCDGGSSSRGSRSSFADVARFLRLAPTVCGEGRRL